MTKTRIAVAAAAGLLLALPATAASAAYEDDVVTPENVPTTVEPGGTLVQASCSSRVTADQLETAVQRAAQATRRRLTRVTRTGHGLDHPIGFPEGEYLKAIHATVS